MYRAVIRRHNTVTPHIRRPHVAAIQPARPVTYTAPDQISAARWLFSPGLAEHRMPRPKAFGARLTQPMQTAPNVSVVGSELCAKTHDKQGGAVARSRAALRPPMQLSVWAPQTS